MNRTVHTTFASLIHRRSLRTFLLLAALFVSASAALALTTFFTYQGRLTEGTIRVGGTDTFTAGETKRVVFGDGEFVSVGEGEVDDRLVLRAGSFRFNPSPTGNTSTRVEPGVDNALQLGSSGLRWSSVWAVNGVIQTSDARQKQAVSSLRYGLRDLIRLRPVSFQWKDGDDRRTHLGLIAQEVEQVLPEAVLRGADPATTLGMNYTDLIPVVIKAVQQQQSVIERKDAELKAVKAQNDALSARLAALEQLMQQLRQQAEKQPKQQ